jgi:predicted amidohydrolase YtcJ
VLVPEPRIVCVGSTEGVAFSLFEEGSRGRVAAGQLAELAVLSGDPYDIDELSSATVDATLVGGQTVYLSSELGAT